MVSCRMFSSQNTENVHSTTLRCLRNFGAAKYAMHERDMPQFSVQKFWSHSTERYFREPFDFSEFFKHRKCSWKGGITIFHWEDFFCPTVPKNVIRETFCVSKNSQFAKNYGWEGWVLSFPSKLFCLTLQKTFICFRKVLVSKKNLVESRE